MLQSHLLQVLAVTTCEAPAGLDPEHLRDSLAAVLAVTQPWTGAPVFPNTDAASRRARYTAGEVDGEQVPDYAAEEGVDPANETETLAEIALEVDNARWAGVPFVLRSGKSIGDPANEIRVHYRPVRFRPDGQSRRRQRGGAPLRLQAAADRVPVHLRRRRHAVPARAGRGERHAPEEPGDRVRRGGPRACSATTRPSPIRGDVAVQCWRIVQPILDSWQRGEVPLDEYPAGSGGPASWS